MFGQFSFKEVRNYRSIFGPFFLIFFIFVATIVYINLIVAILTFTFEKAYREGKADFYMSVISRMEEYEPNSKYGYIVSMPFTMNFFALFPYLYSLVYKSYFTNNYGLEKYNSRFLILGY